jgi:hypothetical protein
MTFTSNARFGLSDALIRTATKVMTEGREFAPVHSDLHDTLTKHGAVADQQSAVPFVETRYHLHNHSTAELHSHLEGHGLKMVTRGIRGHAIAPHEFYKKENGYAGDTTATVHHRNGKPYYMTVQNRRSND